MRITLFEDVRARRRDEREVNFTELVKLISTTTGHRKSDLPLLKLATFGEDRTDKGSLRHDSNVRLVYGLECDYDGEKVTFEEAETLARASGAQVILYTSPSHEPGAPRWRALFPFAGQMLPPGRAKMADRANAIFGAILARETWVLSQAFYYGRINENFRLVALDGAPIDTLREPEEVTYTTESRTDRIPEPTGIEDLTPRVRRAIKGADHAAMGYQSRNHQVFFVACSLVRAGWPDERISSLLLDPQYPVSAHVREQGNPPSYALKQAKDARVKVGIDWERSDKGGILKDSQVNVKRAIESLGVRCFYNTFSQRSYVNGVGPTRELSDPELRKIWLMVERQHGFRPTKDFFQDVVEDIAYSLPVHPVRDRLSALQTTWDSTCRIGSPTEPGWLTLYGEADDNAYTRAVSRLILIAAVRRVRDPGCKFDQMLVLVNPEQGTGKSTVISTLAMEPDWFTDSLPLHVRDEKQVIEQLSGRWIVECAELSGMRHADVESLKAFVVRQVDRARPAFGRLPIAAPRQCVFFGTTNSESFLRDSQNRRFWPVRVGRFNLDALRQNVQQLWAEAAHAEAAGESILLDESLWPLAAAIQAEYRQDDAWTQAISEVLMDLTGRVSATDIWRIIGKPLPQRQQHDFQRIGEAMRELGFARKHARAYGKVQWCYARGDDPRQIYILQDIHTEGVWMATHSSTGDDPTAPPYDNDIAKGQEVPF